MMPALLGLMLLLTPWMPPLVAPAGSAGIMDEFGGNYDPFNPKAQEDDLQIGLGGMGPRWSGTSDTLERMRRFQEEMEQGLLQEPDPVTQDGHQNDADLETPAWMR